MSFQTHSNFAYGTVTSAPDPAASGTTLVMGTATFAQFPNPGTATTYNAVIWPSGTIPLASNAEIVTISAKGTEGTVTIIREQESSSARTIEVGDQIAMAVTKKTLTDVEDTIKDGWVSAGETWVYAGADDPTFTFTISGDKSTKYSAGMKIKLTQTTAKYFIITKVAYSDPNTTITVYGGVDYDLADATITLPYYSVVKAPLGFPLSPAKWTVETTNTSNNSQVNPTQNTWYNLGTITISIPIGVWNVSYFVVADAISGASATDITVQTALSTANNSASDSDFLTYSASAGATGTQRVANPVRAEKVLTVASKTVYYLNERTTRASASTLQTVGDSMTTRVKAVCAYL